MLTKCPFITTLSSAAPWNSPSPMHSSTGIPLQSWEEATGAPQLWLEPWQALLLRIGLKVWLCNRQTSSLVRGQRAVYFCACKRGWGPDGGESGALENLPYGTPSILPHPVCRRIDDALRGWVALLFFLFCSLCMCDFESGLLWPPKGPIVLKWLKCEHTYVEQRGFTLSHNLPANCLIRPAIFIILCFYLSSMF